MRAQVKNGRLVLDEPSTLPEGTEVELVIDDGDELDDEDRARLHLALDEAERESSAGRGRPLAEFLVELRSRG